MAVMAQNVAINNSGNPPAASAILDISSNAKGILIPRMTTAQCSDINAPASGLLIYDTDKNIHVLQWNKLAGYRFRNIQYRMEDRR